MRPSFGSLVQATAVSVATVLGTGILGLPVALHAVGLRPFVLLFSCNLLAQLGVAVATTELLQRAYYAPYDAERYQRVDSYAQSHLCQPPSLHSLAAQFIPYAPARQLFSLVVLLHFLFILSAYAIAGPQAYVALIPVLANLPIQVLQVLFVVVSALVITLAYQRLLPSLTIGTIVKAVLLTVLVSLTLARGLAIRQQVSDSWKLSQLVDPLLMGTIALSGVVNLMPVTFQKCVDSVPPDASNTVDADFISAYRGATILAIVICFVLNISWCVAVLFVVPQTSPLDVTNVVRAAASQSLPCASLQDAYQQGQISTIPLMKVLRCRHDELDSVISFIINMFIALSVTVSFLVMSIGMKHYIDGTAKDTSQSDTEYNKTRWMKYAVYFSVVLVTALSNPQGLFRIMEGITTLALNIEAGMYVLYMLYQSRKEDDQCGVPAPLSRPHVYLIYSFVGLYFVLVVSIDAFYYLPTSLLKR